jgi:rhodanese-related sulfurtransferase
MKRKSTIIALLLAFAMIFGAFSVFAASGLPTDKTRDAIANSAKVQSVPTLKNEVDAERFAMDLYEQTTKGKYKLVDTKTLMGWVDKKSAVVVDTMPVGWYNQRHILGAVQATAGGEDGSKGPAFLMTAAEKKNLLKVVKKATKGNKKKKVVVYCGFTKCQRSHQAAMYLKKKGYKNIYRYAGGISAWVDANYPIEGTDVE